MNKIWGFGDSFTFGHGCRPDGPIAEYYNEYKKPEDKIWLDWLGDYMNMRPVNIGECASSNDSIIDRIIENWYNIKEGDFVIIGITFYTRFDVPINKKLSAGYIDLQIEEENILNGNKLNNLTKEQVETILNFRYHFANNELYKNRQLKRFSFIKQLLKEKNIKYFIWDVHQFARFDSINTIKEDTNGLIDDSHFSFKGHYDFANIVYKKITNNMNVI
jgi:hypothetical protein